MGVQAPLALITVEMLQQCFENNSQEPLAATSKRQVVGNSPTLSEQAVLLLAMIDTLPFQDVDSLAEWLSTIANNLHAIGSSDEDMKSCRTRFWEVLNNGEMDFDRAAVCGRWWNTEGGRHCLISLDSIRDYDEPSNHRAVTRPGKV